MTRPQTSGFSRWVFFVICSLFLVTAGGILAAPQGAGYKVIRRMPVGGDGGWDYLKVDPDAHRLYVSRGDHLMIVRMKLSASSHRRHS